MAVLTPGPRNARANHAVDAINALKHTKGEFAGQPFNLRPWQVRIIRHIFGKLKNGKRQYRTVYIEIPRKNGKTELAAAIALYCLVGDGEAGAEVYCAAAERDQAALVFNAAATMVRTNPTLDDRLNIIDSTKRIVDYRSNSFLKALSSESKTKHGFNASAIIYDELHVAPNRKLWDVLSTSQGARQQPLNIVITTAGYDRHSICYEIHDYAIKVRDGIIDDPTFLPVIYAAEEGADWLDERVWKRANPALGDFRYIDEMRIKAREAKEIPARQNVFRRLYLCEWTEQETRWIDMAVWDRNSDPLRELKGRKCWGGLDLSTTTDVTALVLVFPDDDGTFDVLPLFWIPGDNIGKRVTRDRVPYDQWSREGLINRTDGNVVDYEFIRAKINSLRDDYEIQEIAFDRWNSSMLISALLDDGAPMVQFGQGYASMSAPSKEIEKLLLEGAIRHGGNPVLRWMASNITTRQDPAGNIKPDKEKSMERIDGVVAAIMGLGLIIAAENQGPSVYETRGALVL